MTDVPEGTVQDVLDWVGSDPVRAEEALAVEEAGQNRSTLIAKLETIAANGGEEEEVALSADETLPAEGEEPLPGPEPAPLAFDPDDLTISGVYVNEGEEAPAEPAELEEIVTGFVDVATLQTAGGVAHGFILIVNGTPYGFNAQMTATLKQIVDRAVAGVVL